ncbi:hypothetical protein PVL29_018849 [Vitis rotundifolia]|nr:hypothetical protein PVL29_018849 [Vitis rotundifolia]
MQPSNNSTHHQKTQSAAVPYTIPSWSEPPGHSFYLEVLKDGSIIDQLDVYEKGAYMFGRVDICDFVLEHPTISRFHAVLQFKRNGAAYLYDLGSTHGTFLNKSQVKKQVYTELHVGDVIRFGLSTRLYVFQGPTELMLPESDLKKIREAKILREEMQDREASLSRARREAAFADGISWGMGEDAIEEHEDDADEVTWQTYKGQLTEKQEKTRDKIIKRTEKVANMKKEIDAIRAKDIAQGGLTQGQQTQIARNEQRISQIMEEIENLEETLNESIQESIGARSGRISRTTKKGITENEEEYLSDDDDDEFYDRTKKRSIQKAGENQSVETADTLLDKKDAIIKDMEEKRKLFSIEKNKIVSEVEVGDAVGDTLDAYMSGLSSQLVHDKALQLEKELSTLQSELDRIVYLLKIADPAGETARKRDSKGQEPKPHKSEIRSSSTVKQPPVKQKKICGSEKPADGPIQKQGDSDETMESSKKPEASKIAIDAKESKTTTYSVLKPQWLGAVDKIEVEETPQKAALVNNHESDQFVDYKDRKKALGIVDDVQVKMESGIETAAPGLIIRKRKQVEKSEDSDDKAPEQSTSSSGPNIMAEDAVALLLKHSRGYYASEDEKRHEKQDISVGNQPSKDKKKPKRVLGPERPSFLDGGSDYETWVPPEGQSGDGRTSLNDRFGY